MTKNINIFFVGGYGNSLLTELNNTGELGELTDISNVFWLESSPSEINYPKVCQLYASAGGNQSEYELGQKLYREQMQEQMQVHLSKITDNQINFIVAGLAGGTGGGFTLGLVEQIQSFNKKVTVIAGSPLPTLGGEQENTAYHTCLHEVVGKTEVLPLNGNAYAEMHKGKATNEMAQFILNSMYGLLNTLKDGLIDCSDINSRITTGYAYFFAQSVSQDISHALYRWKEPLELTHIAKSKECVRECIFFTACQDDYPTGAIIAENQYLVHSQGRNKIQSVKVQGRGCLFGWFFGIGNVRPLEKITIDKGVRGFVRARVKEITGDTEGMTQAQILEANQDKVREMQAKGMTQSQIVQSLNEDYKIEVSLASFKKYQSLLKVTQGES